MEDDNWKHRSKKMKCKTCMWFAYKDNTLGRCRRNAPTMGGFPAVFVTDWCGNHKLDEGKIEPEHSDHVPAHPGVHMTGGAMLKGGTDEH